MSYNNRVTTLAETASMLRSRERIFNVKEPKIKEDLTVTGDLTVEGKVVLESDLVLKDTVWDDLRVPMQNTLINPANSEPNFEEWIDGIYAYHFDPGNDDDWSLHFAVQLPHSYKVGTNLRPHLHWAPKTDNTGNVVWEIEYVAAPRNGTFPASASNSTITVAADGVVNKHQIAEFDEISGTGFGISTMLLCRLTRLGDDGADTFTGDAVVLEFDLHFEIDGFGSDDEHVK